jgi:predicted house-cleaning NTP pyrophosphatase (Maf/HAM1 superfamily)
MKVKTTAKEMKVEVYLEGMRMRAYSEKKPLVYLDGRQVYVDSIYDGKPRTMEEAANQIERLEAEVQRLTNAVRILREGEEEL